MDDSVTDMDLVNKVRSGDHLAFEELVSRYSTKAFGLCFRLTRSKEDAQDALQDTFINVFRKLNHFEGKSTFSSWLFRVTVNTTLMRLRKKRQYSRAILLSELSNYEHDKVMQLEDSTCRWLDEESSHYELKDLLKKSIHSLPEEFKKVFILKDVDGMSTHAVGKLLNLTEPAVKSRLHRSRLILRKKLGAFYKEYYPTAQSEYLP